MPINTACFVHTACYARTAQILRLACTDKRDCVDASGFVHVEVCIDGIQFRDRTIQGLWVVTLPDKMQNRRRVRLKMRTDDRRADDEQVRVARSIVITMTVSWRIN